ncbi:hypothetical protein [Clostridium tertium]|uniref:hypothetical protein n=1 Tax=Clostridium tertium TaxID=1559 RepID=UPI0023B2F8C9|nr:hypothetical protein [Clostridium tertium]
MNKATHERGGFTSVILLYPLILVQVQKMYFGTLLYKVIFLILCLVVMLSGSRYGTQYPDYDHQNNRSIPVRNGFTLALNRVLKALGATHRSWHTHALDFNMILFGIPTYIVYNIASTEHGSEYYVWFMFYVLLISFTAAVGMHIILDLFTAGGGYVSIILAVILCHLIGKVDKNTKISQFKVVLAPKWLRYPTFGVDSNGKRRFMMKEVYDKYTTSSTYEKDFRNMLKILNYIAFATTIILLIKYMIY